MSSINMSIDVAASPTQIIGVILDVAAYPAWQREIVKVEVLDTDEQGRPSRVTMHVKAMHKNGCYTVQYDYPSPIAAEYHLIDGDMMTKNDARFSVTDRGDGCSELTVQTELALVWRLPERLVTQLMRKGIKDMLTGIKAQAEQHARQAA